MEETYKPGDIGKITDFYLSNYPDWDVKDKEGVVVSAKFRTIVSAAMNKDDRPPFQAIYGMQKEFPLWEIFVKIEGHTYLVSQLGFRLK